MQQTERLIEFARKQLARLDKHLEGVLERGDVDAVHDFRVASRRLGEPLATMTHWTSQKRTKRVKKRLKRLRRALVNVRDLDVLYESFSEPATRPQLDPEDRLRLDEMLLDQRKDELVMARDALLAAKPQRVQEEVEHLLASFQAASADEGDAVIATARAMWRRRAEALLAQHPTEDGDTDLHACRISLKKLRYSTELLRRMADRERGALIETFVAQQDLLGGWNDHLYAATQLARFATGEEALSRRSDFAAAVLSCAAARARLADTVRCEVLAAWPRLRATVQDEVNQVLRAVAAQA